MLNGDDLAQMQADLATVRDGNAVSVAFRRGNATLTAQTVRLAGVGFTSERRAESGTAQERREQMVVLGATTLNIQIDDRFTLTVGGQPVLYRVTWVRPDRRVATMAKAEAIE
jgi:hypothetical protein